jgi:plastocyanin
MTTMNERLRPLARRALPFLLLVLMTVLAACGSNANGESATNNAAAVTNAEASNSSNAEAAPEEPAEEPAAEEPAEEPAAEPAAEPAEEPAPAAEEPAPAAEEEPAAEEPASHNNGHAEEPAAEPAAEEPAPAAEEPAPAPEKEPAAEEQPAAEAEGKLHVVEIVDFAFAPATLTIAKGDRVSFINKDAVGHTATADDESFDTKMLDQDEAAEIVFGEAGEFGYYCLPHPGMRGTIIVE